MNVIIKYLHCPARVKLRLLSGTVLNKEVSKDGNYTPVYKFPYIRPLAVVNRLKLYQTILTATSVPAVAIMTQMNYVDVDALKATCFLGLSGCITLYGLGFLTSKFIGFIYYNEEKDVAKVAYVDFWGRRRDLEIPASDVIPINELPHSYMDGLFLTFRRYSTKQTLRLNMQYGIILDKEKISKIL
ncbi:transmembrane protein 186 [Leptinotarsa decemlineata]|uniref:transmembrane protein 186 n=1 Tax=Leptinotarsa decemlineata TaxID=7539 RepID=UPI000C2527B5|nr:transmembrane protein 186 [Leptinotarsa decemlineata]XP_023014327.1 transmembrane protein 186 [Leptinotarsa decemlineata]